MFGQWKLKDFDVGAGIAAGASGDSADLSGWIDVDVPGDVHLALVAAGRLAHPYYDRNEGEAEWVETREWWYRTVFHAPARQSGERLTLIFHGLDTFASVWLNGVLLGSSENMFVSVEFDVTEALRGDTENTIAVCFTPVATVLADREGPTWPAMEAIGKTKRNLVRKAQFGWGWDWGPRLPTIGIWRPVELRVEAGAGLRDLHFSTLDIGAEGRSAKVRLSLEVVCHDPEVQPELEISLVDGEGRTLIAETQAVGGEGARRTFDMVWDVQNPRLWWTHDLGEPHLHTLTVCLRDRGDIIEARTEKVGIRTIELDRSPDPDEPGTEFFRFILNHVPIFAKGACWIPAESFVGALSEARYRMLLDAAVDTNMNMIRIWGGGIYEHEAFYDICDENGLLVWQDFMFACAPYADDDPVFVASVEAEIRYQVKRLRNHPSMALWCGNNENQVIQSIMNTLMGSNDRLAGNDFYETLMPDITAALDPTTPYWPGSPYGGIHPNAQESGDVHNWTVWHGFPQIVNGQPTGGIDRSPEGVAYTRYAEDMSRFVSEYGIQASPVMETLRRNVPPDALVYKSPAMEHRIKDVPKHKVDLMMTTVTGIPENLEQYVDFTMMTQAEGLKFGIEHFRRRRPHCSGSLIWQLNDCWPGVSWSIVDYYGFGKAGYYYVRRAYAPVIASFKVLECGDVELWVTNDTRAAIDDEAEIELGDFASGMRWSEACAFHVAAGESRPVWRGAAGKVEGGASRYLRVSSKGGHFPVNRHFFAALKALQRDKVARPEVIIRQVGPHELEVELAASTYLYFVHLLVADEATHFSDNYFDLAPGERRIIRVTNKQRPLTPDDLTIATG